MFDLWKKRSFGVHNIDFHYAIISSKTLDVDITQGCPVNVKLINTRDGHWFFNIDDWCYELRLHRDSDNSSVLTNDLYDVNISSIYLGDAFFNWTGQLRSVKDWDRTPRFELWNIQCNDGYVCFHLRTIPSNNRNWYFNKYKCSLSLESGKLRIVKEEPDGLEDIDIISGIKLEEVVKRLIFC